MAWVPSQPLKNYPAASLCLFPTGRSPKDRPPSGRSSAFGLRPGHLSERRCDGRATDGHGDLPDEAGQAAARRGRRRVPHGRRRHLQQEPGVARLHPVSGAVREAAVSARRAGRPPLRRGRPGPRTDGRCPSAVPPDVPELPRPGHGGRGPGTLRQRPGPLLGQLRGRRDGPARLRHPAELPEGRAGAARGGGAAPGHRPGVEGRLRARSSPAWSAPTARSRTTTRRSSPGSSRPTGTTCSGSCPRRSRRRRTSPSWPGSS